MPSNAEPRAQAGTTTNTDIDYNTGEGYEACHHLAIV
jgi:hypothetical protein